MASVNCHFCQPTSGSVSVFVNNAVKQAAFTRASNSQLEPPISRKMSSTATTSTGNKTFAEKQADRMKRLRQLDTMSRSKLPANWERLKIERKKEREKTKGGKWFGMPATELTEEVKRDLEVLQMRSVLDPKHFYKKNDMNQLPKYFQIGKVVDAPLDACLTKKERKKTLVGELLADFEFRKYSKRKYKEIIEEKQKTHYKAWRNAKKLKKKK